MAGSGSVPKKPGEGERDRHRLEQVRLDQLAEGEAEHRKRHEGNREVDEKTPRRRIVADARQQGREDAEQEEFFVEAVDDRDGDDRGDRKLRLRHQDIDRLRPGVAAQAFQALAAKNINIRHGFNHLTHGALLYKRKGNTSPSGKKNSPRVDKTLKKVRDFNNHAD